jgi:cytidylate kinase
VTGADGHYRRIVLSGDLGSGKSSVAQELSARLRWRVVGSGDVQRAIAARMGLSTLQMNWLAEEKASIDAEIDGALAALADQDEPLIVDARMAWHFVPDSLKVHLVVAPSVGAERLLKGRFSAVEQYSSMEDARTGADVRFASERRRFLLKYGVDIARLRNYHVIADASDATPVALAELILAQHAEGLHTGTHVFVSPRRVVPTGDLAREIAAYPDELDGAAEVAGGGLTIGYSRPFFFLLHGARPLSRHLDQGTQLAPADLEAEGDEVVVGGMSADEYIARETRLSWIYDWEDAHGFRFAEYPQLATG